jgi:hypothetical protein
LDASPVTALDLSAAGFEQAGSNKADNISAKVLKFIIQFLPVGKTKLTVRANAFRHLCSPFGDS